METTQTTAPTPTLTTDAILSTPDCPNAYPTLAAPYRIAFIGEAPGETEAREHRPFVGASGALLWALAAKHGIVRDACLVANVCQHRPPGNDIKAFAWDGREIQSGLAALARDLESFQPNICVLLGNTPLRAFLGETGILNWRGSLFHGRLGHEPTTPTYKCLAALHPAAVLREYQHKTLLDKDLARARAESTSPTLTLPSRDLRVDLTLDDILHKLQEIITRRSTISIDIEGYWNNISCISIAESPTSGFTIPLIGWEPHEERVLLVQLASVLGDRSIPKILQNALYDTFCLQHGYQIPVRGIVDDTMLAHWELLCELPKSLAFQASVYTREPYWKAERESEDRETRLLYCAKDSAVTYECRDVLRRQLAAQSGGVAQQKGAGDGAGDVTTTATTAALVLSPSPLSHYNFNLACLEPLLYMECKGILYDKTLAQTKTTTLQDQVHRLQYALNRVAGVPTPNDIPAWVDIARNVFCFKRSYHVVRTVSDILPYCKISCLQRAERFVYLLVGVQEGRLSFTHAVRGELSILTETCLNTESSQQIADYLYRVLGLPIQYKKEHGKKTDRETTDVLALLTLYKKVGTAAGTEPDPTLKLILKLRAIRTRLESLTAECDPDGRIRCGYNIVGTETGRLSCYEAPTGSGFNLQTVTKKDRNLFLPDPGYWMFQCDLSGADGWTVAAHCLAQGDPTMMEDYLYGLKPARIIALIYMHGKSVLSWDRATLKERSKSVPDDGWLYFACKRVQHGSNYGMGSLTMSGQILQDSYKLFGEPIYVSPQTCDILQPLYFLRYPGITKWHLNLKKTLRSHGQLTSASGHRRTFFGRRDDHNTFKQACSDEPQNNTTYATNAALFKLWTDRENRTYLPPGERVSESATSARLRGRVTLRIQPLHQVHDALIGQFRKEDTAWACGKIREWFNNPMMIAGQHVVIPFEGAYGKSWGDLKEGRI